MRLISCPIRLWLVGSAENCSGMQEHFSADSKATSGLLGGVEASYTPVHLYNILIITHVLGLASDLGNNSR